MKISAKRELSHTPHCYMKYGAWRCVSHNARGNGDTCRAALQHWSARQRAFEGMQKRNTFTT